MFLEAPVEWVKQVYVSESFYGTCTQGNMQDCMESCTPKHGEEKLNRKVLERLNETGYEIVSDNVFKSVSDTQTPQGILCVIKKPEYALEEMLKGEQTHLLILESIQDPGNLGTMVRTGEGAGITGVIMNQTTVDLFNPFHDGKHLSCSFFRHERSSWDDFITQRAAGQCLCGAP